MTFQQVILIGYLGSNPETKRFDGGGSITNFTVATTERWTDKTTGEKKELTEWHNCSCPGKRGEAIEEFFGKGSRIQVIGKNRTRKWQDKDGNDRYSTGVRVDSFNFMDSKSSATQTNNAPAPSQSAQPMPGNNNDDDLPF